MRIPFFTRVVLHAKVHCCDFSLLERPQFIFNINIQPFLFEMKIFGPPCLSLAMYTKVESDIYRILEEPSELHPKVVFPH
jgi:hypothetical protein